MSVKTILAKLAAAVSDEASRNPDFARRIEDILAAGGARRSKEPSGATPKTSATGAKTGRRGGRRPPARLDPVALAPSGEFAVRDALRPLELDLLLDIVAEYGMDPGKQVMKWKDRDRVIDRIVELSMSRATKGDAFREG